MKSKVFIIVLWLAFFGLNMCTLRAQTWNIGTPNPTDVTATLSGSTLTISGTGAMMDWNYGYTPWKNYCNIISTVTINSGVTSIGDYAFYDCINLTSATIGNSVTAIGYYAFAGCDGLTSVTIPNSVTSIGNYVFVYCSDLISISIGNSVTSIGNYVFSYCSSLTTIDVDSNNLAYSSDNGVLFNKNKTTLIQHPEGKTGAYVIPNTVTSIGDYAFAGCNGLTSVTIPNSVTSIGNYAFYTCASLTSVTIPNSVTSIGFLAFYYCSGLTSITISNSVTNIGESAFEECRSLASVTIPNSVASIGQWAFSGCSSLAVISCFAATPPTIGGQFTFAAISSQAKVYVPCASLTTYKAAPYWKVLSYGNCNELAIAETQPAAITVYPNPVVDQLTIESDGYIIYSIQITDLTGKTVLATSAIINNTINVSSLSAGVYFLKIKTDKGEVVKKVIKNSDLSIQI